MKVESRILDINPRDDRDAVVREVGRYLDSLDPDWRAELIVRRYRKDDDDD